MINGFGSFSLLELVHIRGTMCFEFLDKSSYLGALRVILEIMIYLVHVGMLRNCWYVGEHVLSANGRSYIAHQQ